MTLRARNVAGLLAATLSFFAAPVWAQSGTWVLPSSAFRAGQNGAEFHTDVRILNLGASQVTVTATFYDQASGAPISAPGFPIAGRSQASFDNILQALFGRTLGHGAYGPIRFDSTGPITVSSSVNNVNACGAGATSGQWLPGIPASEAMTGGAIAQLAVSSNSGAGYRTNLVIMNPGTASATATVKVRSGGGVLVSTGTVGPLVANGFTQVALDNGGVFPGVAGRTDTNVWVEFTSDQPVLAFASVINNASGDPFAVLATRDAFGALPAQGAWDGTWAGSTANGRTVSFDVASNRVVKFIFGGAVGLGTCGFDTFLTFVPGYAIGSNGSFTFDLPASTGTIGVSRTGNLTATGTGSGLYNYTITANSLPGQASCSGSGTATFTVTRRALPPAHQSWDGTWKGTITGGRGWGRTVSFDVVGNQIVKLIYGGAISDATCGFDTFLTPQPGWPVGSYGSFTFSVPATAGTIGIIGTGNLITNGSGGGLYSYTVTANSLPGQATCNGTGAATFAVARVGGAPPHP